MATSISKGSTGRVPKSAESGFSLIEVMISMVLLTVGMVSLLGVFGMAMASTQTSQQDMIAKQLANEALESIITARNTSQMTFDDIQNTGSVNCWVTGASSCGVFLVGAQPIYNSGADGIYGTSDDAAAGAETLREPGPDGVYGNSNDVIIPLTPFQRKIEFLPVYDAQGNLVKSLREVKVTMQYSTPQTKLQKSYVLDSFISQFQ